jgi:hypothetical protein
VEGGMASADVVGEKIGPDSIRHKHISDVKYAPITISVGTGMTRAFYDWVSTGLSRSSSFKDGAIIDTDFERNELSRLQFTKGLITEIGFPALDGSSKDTARMTIKIAPEYTRHKKGSGTLDPSAPAGKKWLPSNFRLSIAGLEGATKRVNKIEALTIKQKTVERATGEIREAAIEPSTLEIPNLVVTLPEADAAGFFDWHQSFVVDGNCGADREKTGTLEYLASDGTVLFTLNLSGLGIFKLTPDKVEAGGENIRRVKAEMYCENLTFSIAK